MLSHLNYTIPYVYYRQDGFPKPRRRLPRTIFSLKKIGGDASTIVPWYGLASKIRAAPQCAQPTQMRRKACGSLRGE